MFVPFVFTLDERPWSENFAQGDIFYIYADACIAYGWPIIAPERYFSRFLKVEDPLWGMAMKDFVDYMCMRKVPTPEEMEAINAYPILQTCEDSVIAKYPSKADCLNDLLTNDNVEFEQIIGELLDKITSDFCEKPEGILCFEILPKSLITAADKRGIPVIFQLNGLLRRPLYKLRQHPRASFLNCMSLKNDFSFHNIKTRYEKFLSEKADLPMLSRKGILRLFFEEQYMMDIHCIDNEPEYEVGVLYNSFPAPIHFFGKVAMPDNEMSLRACQRYDKVLIRARPGFSQYTEVTTSDDSPSCFHFCCKCKRVVGSMTKGMFDAMLAGRIAHEYGSFIFHLFCNDGIEDENKSVAPLEFINFAIFLLWAPFPWLTDISHLRLSISESFEKELYMRSFNYFTSGISKEDLELYYMTSGREYRLGDPLYFTCGHKPHEYGVYYCTGGLRNNEGVCTWANDKSTSFEFDLTEQVNEPLIISVVLYEVAIDWNSQNPAQTVTCEVNGIDCGSITLVPGKKYLRFTIPSECFTDKLQVTFRYGYLHTSGDFKIAIAFEQMYISRIGQRMIEDSMSYEIASSVNKVSLLETQISELGSHNSELSMQISELESQNSELRAQKSGLESHNSELRILNSDLQSQNSELTIQNSELEVCNSELREQNSELESCNSDLREQNSELESNNSGLKAQIAGLEEQIQLIYSTRSWKLGNGVMKIAASIVPRKYYKYRAGTRNENNRNSSD